MVTANKDVSTDLVSDEVLRRIAEKGQVRSYPARAILLNEGDPGDALYIILSGKVKAFAIGSSGKEVVYNVHGPGEYLGELSLDGQPRSASIMTLEPTTCSVVHAGNLRNFIAEHPDFALHLIHKLIRLVRQSTENVKSLALDDVYSRVVRLLMENAVTRDGKLVIEERLTQQGIADRVGSSREMVSRIFKELTVGKYIAVESKQIVILKKPPPAW
ncbi:MAG: Crp/Fnr family transcriptional regulator [Burkholderiaceae bacterium]|jgi:CRP/FNR family cyclic AMP-dependent transcriptional regulator